MRITCALLLATALVVTLIGCRNGEGPALPGASASPTASALPVSTPPLYVGEPVSFDASGSVDNDDNGEFIFKWEWDWENDGVFDTLLYKPQASHTFIEAGTHEIQLRVTDDEGETDTLDQPLSVEIVTMELLPPVAYGAADTQVQDILQPVHFYDAGSFDPDGGPIQKYEWDFENDGIFDEEGASIEHSWSLPGIYHVQFRVTDDEGTTDELDIPIEITIRQVLPFNPVDVTPPWLNMTPQDVAFDGNVAYVVGVENGLHVYDVSDPANPIWLGHVAIDSEIFNTAASEGYAYVLAEEETYVTTLQIVDCTTLSSPVIVNSLELNSAGRDLDVSGGYVYIAGSAGLTIVDVHSPESPVIIAELITTFSRDTVILHGNYAFLSSHGYARTNIIDISDPFNPENLGRISDGSLSIAVDPSGQYLYIPVIETTVFEIDYSRPEDSEIVASLDTPGYPRTFIVGPSGEYAYTVDMGVGMSVIDLQNPANPQIVNSIETGGQQFAGGVIGDYMYLVSWLVGIDIICADPPESPYVVNTIPSLYDSRDVAAADGFVYVADFESDIRVIDANTPESAYIVNTVYVEGEAESVEISGDYLYEVSSAPYMHSIIDISSPGSPFLAGTIDPPNGTLIAAVSPEGYAFYFHADKFDPRLGIIDFVPPSQTFIAGWVPTNGYPFDFDVSGGYAFLVQQSGLEVVDVDPPESANTLGTVTSLDGAGGYIATSDGYALVFRGTVHTRTMYIVDIDPAETSYVVGTVELDPHMNVKHLASYCGCAYLFDRELAIYDYTPPETAELVSMTDLQTYAKAIAFQDNYAFLACGEDGLRVLRLW